MEKTHICIETSALKKQQKTEKITATTTTKAKQTKHKNKENSAYTVKKHFQNTKPNTPYSDYLSKSLAPKTLQILRNNRKSQF